MSRVNFRLPWLSPFGGRVRTLHVQALHQIQHLSFKFNACRTVISVSVFGLVYSCFFGGGLGWCVCYCILLGFKQQESNSSSVLVCVGMFFIWCALFLTFRGGVDCLCCFKGHHSFRLPWLLGQTSYWESTQGFDAQRGKLCILSQQLIPIKGNAKQKWLWLNQILCLSIGTVSPFVHTFSKATNVFFECFG